MSKSGRGLRGVSTTRTTTRMPTDLYSELEGIAERSEYDDVSDVVRTACRALVRVEE